MDIIELRERIMTLPTLQKDMELLRKEILDATTELSRLLRKYEQESRDVEKIKKETLTSFMFKVIGKYEDKLRKEEREEIDAKLAYDRAVTHLENLEKEKGALASCISALESDKKTYNAELKNRRLELADQPAQPEGALYLELENGQISILSQMTEIRQALSAAARVKSTAQSTLRSLEKAEDWATFDTFTRGGIITHMAKYSHIDDAERNFHTLSSQLRHLKTELKDVQGLAVPGLSEISSTQRAVDFWFDNIFTDLSVRKQIKGNVGQINNLLRSVSTIESALKTKERQLESDLKKNRKREEELLISLRGNL